MAVQLLVASGAARPDGPVTTPRRLAVIDLGSNSFRLVVFTAAADEGWWKRTDEIYEPVRIGEGLGSADTLARAPMERALATIDVFAHFCRASALAGDAVDAVATSAIRDARNAAEFLALAREHTDLPIRVLSREEEARYGYLAAINSTTLRDGSVLDLGGGSMQLVGVEGRLARASGSWPLGAVRMTERFLSGKGPAKRRQLDELAAHARDNARRRGVAARAGAAGSSGSAGRCATWPRRRSAPPANRRSGFRASSSSAGRSRRSSSGSPRCRRPSAGACRGSSRRGPISSSPGPSSCTRCSSSASSTPSRQPRPGCARASSSSATWPSATRRCSRTYGAASVRNLAAQYHADGAHTEHVAALALGLFDDLAAAGLHDGDPVERELLEAACVLHDIGMSVDYDDHHKHTRYLILNAGLPGFSPREVALIAQTARYHRKGMPDPGPLASAVRRR